MNDPTGHPARKIGLRSLAGLLRLSRLVSLSSLLRLSGLMLLSGLLAACAPRLDVIGVDNPERPVASVAEATRQKVFIMTTREASEFTNVFYSTERARDYGLASVVVSIPPNHVPGALEVPRRLPPDPTREFAVIDPVVYARDGAFLTALNQELAKRLPGDRRVLFFVHGYNNTTSEAVLRLGQFVEDSGFTGVPVLFTWASGAQASKYVYDLNSALVARQAAPALVDLLTRANAESFDLFAHSMGAFLTMEGLVQGHLSGRLTGRNNLNAVVLASPDIDIDLFRSQLAQIGQDRPELYILVSKDDGILRLSRTLSGGVDRVGVANTDELADLGVTVIDMSAVDDNLSNSHSKFASSPEVVQLLGRGLNSELLNTTDRNSTLVEWVAGLPIRVVYD